MATVHSLSTDTRLSSLKSMQTVDNYGSALWITEKVDGGGCLYTLKKNRGGGGVRGERSAGTVP